MDGWIRCWMVWWVMAAKKRFCTPANQPIRMGLAGCPWQQQCFLVFEQKKCLKIYSQFSICTVGVLEVITHVITQHLPVRMSLNRVYCHIHITRVRLTVLLIFQFI